MSYFFLKCDIFSVGSSMITAGIEVDTDWMPSVVSIVLNVSESTQIWDVLAPGEMVSIAIEFSGPVAVEGKPLLHLSTGIAEFVNVDVENPSLLWFSYTVQLGDFSSNPLTWEDEEAFKANDHQTSASMGIVYRASASEISLTLLQTQRILADITLPDPSGSSSVIIFISRCRIRISQLLHLSLRISKSPASGWPVSSLCDKRGMRTWRWHVRPRRFSSY